MSYGKISLLIAAAYFVWTSTNNIFSPSHINARIRRCSTYMYTFLIVAGLAVLLIIFLLPLLYGCFFLYMCVITLAYAYMSEHQREWIRRAFAEDIQKIFCTPRCQCEWIYFKYAARICASTRCTNEERTTKVDSLVNDYNYLFFENQFLVNEKSEMFA